MQDAIGESQIEIAERPRRFRVPACCNVPRVAGHSEGVKAVRNTVRAAGEVGIEYLTLYAFSSENWNRPRHEVSTLMNLLERSIDRELP